MAKIFADFKPFMENLGQHHNGHFDIKRYPVIARSNNFSSERVTSLTIQDFLNFFLLAIIYANLHFNSANFEFSNEYKNYLSFHFRFDMECGDHF